MSHIQWIEVLCELQDSESTDLLGQAMFRDDRSHCVRALARIGTIQAIAALNRGLGQGFFPGLILECADALARLCARDCAIRCLGRAMSAPYAWERSMVA